MTDLETYSNTYMDEVYDFYCKNFPFHPHELVKIYDEDHKLWAIGKVVGVYWSERFYDWIANVEYMDEHGLCVDDFSAHQLTRHTGFCGVAV